MVDLDEVAQQEENEGDQGAGVARFQRRRGQPRSWKDSRLPTLKRVKNKILIPRSMVNREWLTSEDGKVYDSPKFIADHGSMLQDAGGLALSGEGPGEEEAEDSRSE